MARVPGQGFELCCQLCNVKTLPCHDRQTPRGGAGAVPGLVGTWRWGEQEDGGGDSRFLWWAVRVGRSRAAARCVGFPRPGAGSPCHGRLPVSWDLPGPRSLGPAQAWSPACCSRLCGRTCPIREDAVTDCVSSSPLLFGAGLDISLNFFRYVIRGDDEEWNEVLNKAGQNASIVSLKR